MSPTTIDNILDDTGVIFLNCSYMMIVLIIVLRWIMTILTDWETKTPNSLVLQRAVLISAILKHDSKNAYSFLMYKTNLAQRATY